MSHNRYSEWVQSNQISYGKLTLIGMPSDYQRLVDSAPWLCECGHVKMIKIINVLNGLTKSCGCSKRTAFKHQYVKPELIFSSSWLQQFPDLINGSLPESWSRNTHQKFQFRCKCGKTYWRKFSRYNPE